MTALVVALFLLFGYVEMRRVWQDACATVALEQRADTPTSSATADAAADRARRAYAIRCSCDGRDS